MSKVLVFGSYAADLVSRASRLPGRGETVTGTSFSSGHGGKGSNQAVAANRLGCDVTFATRIGDDDFGRRVRDFYAAEGLRTRLITDPHHSTGTALIFVEEGSGANQILMVPGACGAFTPAEIDSLSDEIEACNYLLLQMEINLDALEYVMTLARCMGKKIVLNTAPVREIPEKYLAMAYLITPNEHEASALTGVAVSDTVSAGVAAERFHSMGVQNVLITMGSAGSLLSVKGGEQRAFSAYKVNAVDTTGAGDVFNGALVTALSEGRTIPDAVDFASRAAAVSVTRQGAALSAPTRREAEAIA